MGDTIYNKFFFNDFYENNGGGNYLKKQKWMKFFNNIAKEIVDNFNPKTVLDAGCACGYLVEALRDLGVEAYGIDISEYAINSARKDIKQFLNAQSITECLPKTFPEKFDLVVTIEVLEHLFPEDGRKAIELLCSYSDTVIFTSTPDDISDRTHVNVQQSEYWAEIFACNSFYRDLIQPMDFICPWAMLFRKNEKVSEVIFNYELNKRIDKINHIRELADSRKIKGSVFFDSGNSSFTENSKASFIYDAAKAEKIRIEVPSGCKKLRIDPIEGRFIAINNLIVGSNAGLLPISSTNAKSFIEDSYYFENTDPQIIIDLANKSILWIEISFNAIIIDSSLDLRFFSVLNAKIEQFKNENDVLNRTISEETQKNEILNKTYSSKIEKLNSEYDTELEKIKSEYDAELSKLNSEHDTELEKLNSELEKLNAENAHYKEHYHAAINQREELKRQVAEYDYALNAMRNAQFWKITAPARKIVGGIKKILYKNKATRLFCKGLLSLKREGFKKTWQKVKCKFSSDYKVKQIAKSYKITAQERAAQENTVFDKDIKFSILVPLYNTPINFLDEMIASVKAQTYSNWELCLADGSDKEHDNVRKEVLKLSKKDNRIKYRKLEKNLGISENTNACIDMSTGDYIALFDHDDILHPSALFEVMKAICENNADFIYTDEATFESPDINKIITAHFKPDFAIDNLRANNYICHLSAFSREVVKKAGKFRHKYDGSQDHDMILRLTKAAKTIVHIPKILYYWRSHPMSVAQDINSKTYAIQAGKNAVHDSIETYGYECMVESSRAFPTIYRIKYEIKSKDLISIIIPNKNHYDDLKKCIDSILNNTTYPNYEIIIVDNGSDDEKVFEYYEKLKKDKRFVICSLYIKFNYSKLNNYAITKASGKYYVLLNNDIEIITPEWIEEMLMYVQREDVGAAGAMLYYPDDTIQHAGIILKLGSHRVAGHAFHKCSRNSIGYMGRLCYAQNMSAVTAACMMVKASVYKEVGGLDESFEVAYNDVDFCLKIRTKNYNIVWTPYCEAYHYESKSRGSDFTPEQQNRFQSEVDRFKKKWKIELEKGDPYYNPNFTLDRSDFSFKR